jgi:YHS domain-containing protein
LIRLFGQKQSNTMKATFILILFIFPVSCALAQVPSYFNSDGVAIKGHDPVAYFSENAAVVGLKQFSYSWQGVDWYFKTQANLNAFKASPENYAPQFGGYCAYGASEDHKSPTEPEAFTIVNNKLYLNYNLKVRELWRKDTKGRIEKAEKNWVTLKDKAE